MGTATARATLSAGTDETTVPLADVATMDPELQAQVVAVLRSARYTTFSTGSDGFRAIGKIINAGGHRYQASVQLVRIGSKTCKAV